MSTKIYILLPVHNRKAITEKFIECLLLQTFKNYHLILIDDGSTDGTDEMVKAKVDKLTIIKGYGDWWWGGSLQKGFEWLKVHNVQDHDLVLLINDDVIFSADYLEQAYQVMTKKNAVLMLSKIKPEPGNNPIETGVFADFKHFRFEQAKTPDSINCLPTRGLFVHWQDMKVIGNFYPRLLPHYLSDYEYTIRGHRKGIKCETSDNILIEPDFETTGYHKIQDHNFQNFLKKYFSKRSANNPIYWVNFVILSSEFIWIIPNILKILYRSIKTITKAFLLSLKY